MRLLIFDPFHGAAGDMITGALIDCGADRSLVIQAMESVVAEPAVSRVSRAGIRAVKVDTRAMPAHRTFAEVMERLDAAASCVPAPALAMARRVFERIRNAEEEVHGEQTHFHEVGADDAIADIVGACTALELLAIDGVIVRPVALGHGTATGSHGTFPIPAPATAIILRDAGLPVTGGGDEGELCTPTGAALLAEFSSRTGAEPAEYTILATGHGAGTRNPHHAPNVLRAMLVETTKTLKGLDGDTVEILETNVDDVSGEVIAHAIACCMEAGARDASAIPIVMKKGRPGFLVRVISLPETSGRLAGLMAQELGTLGIRCLPAVHRLIADREVWDVEVEIAGERRMMPVKCGMMNGKVYTLKAEFGPACNWATELDLPVREVLRAVGEAGWKALSDEREKL